VQEYSTNHMNGLRHCSARIEDGCINSCFLGQMWKAAGGHETYGGPTTSIPEVIMLVNNMTEEEMCQYAMDTVIDYTTSSSCHPSPPTKPPQQSGSFDPPTLQPATTTPSLKPITSPTLAPSAPPVSAVSKTSKPTHPPTSLPTKAPTAPANTNYCDTYVDGCVEVVQTTDCGDTVTYCLQDKASTCADGSDSCQGKEICKSNVGGETYSHINVYVDNESSVIASSPSCVVLSDTCSWKDKGKTKGCDLLEHMETSVGLKCENEEAGVCVTIAVDEQGNHPEIVFAVKDRNDCGYKSNDYSGPWSCLDTNKGYSDNNCACGGSAACVLSSLKSCPIRQPASFDPPTLQPVTPPPTSTPVASPTLAPTHVSDDDDGDDDDDDGSAPHAQTGKKGTSPPSLKPISTPCPTSKPVTPPTMEPTTSKHDDEEDYCCSYDYKNCSNNSWCDKEKSRCEGNCNGTWMGVNNCATDGLARWKECTNYKDSCCSPATCTMVNPHYWQCLSTHVSDDDGGDEDDDGSAPHMQTGKKGAPLTLQPSTSTPSPTSKPVAPPTMEPTTSKQSGSDGTSSPAFVCSRPADCSGVSCQIQCPLDVPTGYYPDLSGCDSYCYCTGTRAPSRYETCQHGLLWDPLGWNAPRNHRGARAAFHYLSGAYGKGTLWGSTGGTCNYASSINDTRPAGCINKP